jgi:hypothetical protein
MSDQQISPAVAAQRAIREAKKELSRGRGKAPLQISDDERRARSERMKKLNAEGKRGKGGRPKVKSVSEYMAEKNLELAEEAAKVIKDGLNARNRIGDRLATVNVMRQIEEQVGKARSRELDDIAKMSDMELNQSLAQALLEGSHLEGVREYIDGHYEELEQMALESGDDATDAEVVDDEDD